MEEEACAEEEEEDGESGERDVTFLGKGDYDGFPASSPEWKHGIKGVGVSDEEQEDEY